MRADDASDVEKTPDTDDRGDTTDAVHDEP
jgi:hypothetical protein